MVENQQKDLDQCLFNEYLDLSNEQQVNILFGQYQLMVNSTENVVSRRQRMHTFFFSINSLLIGALGTILGTKFEVFVANKIVLVVALCVVGGVIAWSWRQLLISYQKLNSGKFKVINKIEEKLPSAIFNAEWHILGEGNDSKRYNPFTKLEHYVPLIFLLLYCTFFLELVIGLDSIITSFSSMIKSVF